MPDVATAPAPVVPSTPATVIPTAATPAAPEPALAPVTADALIKRVAEAPAKEAPLVPPSLGKLDDVVAKVKLDDIKDPVQRQLMEQRLKVANDGLLAKFNQLDAKAKEVETLRQSIEAEKAAPWTPERIQSLMSNANFVTAAQQAVARQQVQQPPPQWTDSKQAWSALTDAEQTAFRSMQGRLQHLEQTNDQLMNRQEHDLVRTKFPDYDAAKVESLQSDILAGKYTGDQVKELIWKAANFERYIESSYQYGLQDRQGTLQQKRDGASVGATGLTSVEPAVDLPVRSVGERTANYFRQLAQRRLAARGNGQ